MRITDSIVKITKFVKKAIIYCPCSQEELDKSGIFFYTLYIQILIYGLVKSLLLNRPAHLI